MVEGANVSTDTARAAILGRIKTALGDEPANESPDSTPISRDYRLSATLSRAELLAHFIERVSEYKAIVHKVAPAGLGTAITDACRKREVKTLAIPADLPAGWAPDGVTLLRDPGLTVDQLDSADGVLTACALAIAQTGTIVLDCGPGQGRRALSLLPDYHLYVVRDNQVVGLVPEAIAQLQGVMSSPGRPVTLISGPSATSDIELNRVEGVHGPRTLEVIVVETGPASG
jgi:L-lactate dehydrogenase complex protein LldG